MTFTRLNGQAANASLGGHIPEPADPKEKNGVEGEWKRTDVPRDTAGCEAEFLPPKDSFACPKATFFQDLTRATLPSIKEASDSLNRK